MKPAKNTKPDPHWLDRIVAGAVRDYALRRDENNKLHAHRVLERGVTRQAHSWCVDLVGKVESLKAVGCPAEWFADAKECKEVSFGGRDVEIFRGFGKIEVSIRYSDGERP